MNSPLTDTPESAQLYLLTLFSIPLSQLPFFFLNSRKHSALLTDTFSNSRGCPLTREYKERLYNDLLIVSIVRHPASARGLGTEIVGGFNDLNITVANEAAKGYSNSKLSS